MKYKPVKLLEGNVGENPDHLGYGNAFLDITDQRNSGPSRHDQSKK